MTAPFRHWPDRLWPQHHLLLLVAGMATVPLAPAVAAEPTAPQELALPVIIRIARCQGSPVRSPRWVMQHVEQANSILSQHKVRLAARIDFFDSASCELTTAKERSALARHTDPERVTVLVVRRLQDLALPTYDLMGVHWRYSGARSELRGRRWIYLTARARPPVLAHELAHYLGLPHDPAGGNLMTPGPSDPIWRRQGDRPAPYAPLFTRAQGRRLRRAVRQVLSAPAGADQIRPLAPEPSAAPPKSGAGPYPPR